MATEGTNIAVNAGAEQAIEKFDKILKDIADITDEIKTNIKKLQGYIDGNTASVFERIFNSAQEIFDKLLGSGNSISKLVKNAIEKIKESDLGIENILSDFESEWQGLIDKITGGKGVEIAGNVVSGAKGIGAVLKDSIQTPELDIIPRVTAATVQSVKNIFSKDKVEITSTFAKDCYIGDGRIGTGSIKLFKNILFTSQPY